MAPLLFPATSRFALCVIAPRRLDDWALCFGWLLFLRLTEECEEKGSSVPWETGGDSHLLQAEVKYPGTEVELLLCLLLGEKAWLPRAAGLVSSVVNSSSLATAHCLTSHSLTLHSNLQFLLGNVAKSPLNKASQVVLSFIYILRLVFSPAKHISYFVLKMGTFAFSNNRFYIRSKRTSTQPA